MTTEDASLLTARKVDSVIAFDARGEVPVGRFMAQARSLAERLPRRRYAINLISDRYDYLVGFCAAIIAGQCTLMPPNRQRGTIERLMEDYGDVHVLEERSGIAGAGDAAAPPRIASGQLCAIAFTSGSTGRPQPNCKYWSTLRCGTRSNEALLLKSSDPRLNLVATVPSQHMWGLETSILLPLLCNVAVSHRNPFFPGDIADALASVPEPRALVSSPVHLEALLGSGVSLPPLERVYSATAPLDAGLAARIEARFSTEVLDVFGCSETGILAVRHVSRESNWRSSDFFRLTPHDAGVMIHADHLPADVALPDIVEIIDDRTFRWIGRHKDMLNIAGKRASLVELNRCLRAMPGVIDGVMFVPDEKRPRLAALVVAPDIGRSAILDWLKPQLDPVFLPRPIYRVDTLPRQETGKLTHGAVLELFERMRKSGKPGRHS